MRAHETPVPRPRARRAPGRRAAALLLLLLASCQLLPDEFNLSPLYRQRVSPDGELVEMDFLWPVFHYEKPPQAKAWDFRVRPLWRIVRDEEKDRTAHQFLVPLGLVRNQEELTEARLFPLFWFKQHWNEGRPEQWDRDWMALLLLWGGTSWDGSEDYFAFIPFWGRLRNFLTYDELGFFLWPLYMWTERGKAWGRHIIWPLGGFGGEDVPDGNWWWRALPFFGANVDPGREEHYTALFPFLWWGYRQLHTPYPSTYQRFWPLLGWSVGGAFVAWDIAWPLIRHAHLKEGKAAQALGLPEGSVADGDYLYWDLPWPLFRYEHDSLRSEPRDRMWITPLYYGTLTGDSDLRGYLGPLFWFRHYWDHRGDRYDRYILPFFWDKRIRYRKPRPEGPPATDRDTGQEAEGQGDVEWYERGDQATVYWPLVRFEEDRYGSWLSRGLAPWPFEGGPSLGIREAYDWAWVLWEAQGDALGNSRTRTFLDLWTSRNFAGKRYQCSVPLLFNLVLDERGGGTLRLLQLFPISWGPS
ncbi:MAG: hypothetical protein R3F30_13325 [Planctomycetota bacterium]